MIFFILFYIKSIMITVLGIDLTICLYSERKVYSLMLSNILLGPYLDMLNKILRVLINYYFWILLKSSWVIFVTRLTHRCISSYGVQP